MSDKKIALITGSNRGLGQEIARQLARQGHLVIMSSRTESGSDSAAELAAEGLNVLHLILDVNNSGDILSAKNWIEEEFNRLDILVNNAGVLMDRDATMLEMTESDLRMTLETNTIAPILLTQKLAPLMMKNRYGRIVNISSTMGSLNDMAASPLSSALTASAYRLSKAALNAVTILQAKELCGYSILVNAVCPGWVRTDMGGLNAPLSVEQGAKTPVWLANLPEGGPTGKFFRNMKEIPW